MKQSWEIKKFEELIQENQIGLIKSTKEQANNKPFRYLKMDSITSDNNLIHDKYVFVDATKDEIEKFKLNDGDFLFNTRNSYELVGKTCVFSPIDDEPTLFNNNIMRVVFKKGISSRFINYAFSSEQVKKRLQRLKSGTTSVVGIYYNGLRNLEIPLPPLPEQQLIVSILDEAFAAIAKAKANAEQNLKNAKELFESYLQGVFEKKGDGWEEQLLEDCFKMKSGDNLTAKNMTEGEYPVFGGNGIAGYHNEYNLSGSNVIIGRVGALCGNVRHIAEKIWLTDNAFKVVDFKFDFDHSFLTFLLNHKDLRSYARQAAQPVISNSSLKDVVLNFPKSIETQKTIVRQLDALRAETQKLEAVYQKKIADLEELKKSILQKAFAGELKNEKELEYVSK